MTTRPHARVDADGYVYDVRPRTGGWLYLGAMALLCALLGALLVVWRLGVPPSVVFSTQPLPTAMIATATALPRPTALLEPTAAPAVQPVEPLPTVEQPTPTDPGIAVYVVATPTAELPAPEEEGFAASFEEPSCAVGMITYLPGHECYGRAGQAPLPDQSDGDAFRESFK